MENKLILLKADEALLKGDHEGFLALCDEDIQWNMIGECFLNGKSQLKEWMKENYKEPPEFNIEKLLSIDDIVVVLGEISLQNDANQFEKHSYCDVWQFSKGKMRSLKAFIRKSE